MRTRTKPAPLPTPSPSEYAKKDIIPKMLQMRFDYAFAILQSGQGSKKGASANHRRGGLTTKTLRKAMSKLGVNLTKEDAAEMLEDVTHLKETSPEEFLHRFRNNMTEWEKDLKAEDDAENEAFAMPAISGASPSPLPGTPARRSAGGSRASRSPMGTAGTPGSPSRSKSRTRNRAEVRKSRNWCMSWDGTPGGTTSPTRRKSSGPKRGKRRTSSNSRTGSSLQAGEQHKKHGHQRHHHPHKKHGHARAHHMTAAHDEDTAACIVQHGGRGLSRDRGASGSSRASNQSVEPRPLHRHAHALGIGLDYDSEDSQLSALSQSVEPVGLLPML